jgi:replicative DNA helicase
MNRYDAEKKLLFYALTSESHNVMVSVERAAPFMQAREDMETILAARDGGKPDIAALSGINVEGLLATPYTTVPARDDADLCCQVVERCSADDRRKSIARILTTPGGNHPIEVITGALEECEAALADMAPTGGMVKRIVGIDTLHDLYEKREKAGTGVMLGLGDIDTAMRGVGPGQLFVLAGKGGVGKTAFALQAAREMTTHHNPLFISIEMPGEDLYERIAQAFLKKTGDNISGMAKRGEIDKQAITEAYPGIRFVDVDRISLAGIAAFIRQGIRAHTIDAVFIDHLQRISGDGTDYERVSRNIQGLKSIAKGLKVPIIVLCQLSRKAEDDTQPVTMSMMRDSGRVEEEADYIVGMWMREQAMVAKALKMRRAARGIVVNFKPDLATMRFIPQFNVPREGEEPMETVTDSLPFDKAEED